MKATLAVSSTDGPPAIKKTQCQSMIDASPLASTSPLVAPNAMPTL